MKKIDNNPRSARHGAGAQRPLASLLAFSLLLTAGLARAEPLVVFTTVPDLADLAREVGGNLVEASSMVAKREDPHFAEPRPSFVKTLSQADLFIEIGMELEIGYVPTLLTGARNARVQPGQPGNLQAGSFIAPMNVPTGVIDRSMGDVHPYGNPHFLTDPVQGLAVARGIRDRLSQLRPESASEFAANYEDFRGRMGRAMVGDALAAKYDWEKLVVLSERGALTEFLASQGDAAALGGWLGMTAPLRGTKVVDDHDIWPYFARRFGLQVVAHLEPVPGISPTTAHLAKVIAAMQRDQVPVVVLSPYYDPRHAAFVAEHTGARVVTLAHQVGSTDGADTYLAMVDHNVRAIAEALSP